MLSTTGTGLGDSRVIETIQSVLMQNARLIEVVTKQQEEGYEEGQAKRKTRESTSYQPEEPLLLLEESYRIEDDGHTILDTRLSQRLRQINADPEEYWVKGAFKNPDRPILQSSLYLEHIMPDTVHEGTVCRLYDRTAFVEIKNLLVKNNKVCRESKKKVRVQEIGQDEFSMGVETQWQPADTVFEVVDAGFNFLCLEHMIRPYSYTAIAMIRCLHDSKYGFIRVYSTYVFA